MGSLLATSRLIQEHANCSQRRSCFKADLEGLNGKAENS